MTETPSTGKFSAALFLCFLFVAAYITSRFLLSISMVLIILYAFKTARFSDWFHNLNKNKEFIFFPVYFLMIAANVLVHNHGDWNPVLEELRIKLPFFFLPLAIANWAPFRKNHFYLILAWTILIATAGSVWSVMETLGDYENISQSYYQGKVLPTPIHHIRFSLFVVVAIVSGFYLFMKKFHMKWRWEIWIYLFLTCWLILYLHILAVRSGLLALYGVLTIYGIIRIIKEKRLFLGISLLLFFGSAPYLAYKYIPSFKGKIDYMRWDLQQYRQKNFTLSYSDTKRLLAWEMGIKAGLQNPWFGVGFQNITETMDAYYEQYDPPIPENLRLPGPHNQFITVFAGSGFTGLAVFLIMITVPLFYRKNFKNRLLTGFHVIMFTSFLSESTLEVQLGIALYLFYLLFMVHQLRNAAL